jgi:hypothetical protein
MFRMHAGGRPRPRHRRRTWAYTQNVAFWAKRLTSLTAAFALSGASAVLSACMALCLQAMPAAATPHQQSGLASHGAHTPAPAVASGHAHHPSPASHEPVASAVDDQSSPRSPHARLIAPCDNYCPDGVALVAGPGVERTDARAFGAAPLVSSVASLLATRPVVGAMPHSPPVPPPSPTRTPLVLRI